MYLYGMDTGQPLERELDIQRQALKSVRDRLPPQWNLSVAEQPSAGSRRIDAVVTIAAPNSPPSTVVVETKRSLVTRDLPQLVDRLRSASAELPGEDPSLMIIARYLAPPVRDWLEQQGVSYADATGNLLLRLSSPALFLRDRGADGDPWRGPGRPRGTLKGEPAARVVRALADFRAPISVPDLAARSRASTGATYRVVEFLQDEMLLERAPRAPIATARWRAILERWSQDYGFQASNTVLPVLQPRGLESLMERIRKGPTDVRYAVTGSLAAANWEPYAQPRLAMIYVDDPAEFMAKMELRPVDVGANVLLAAPGADFVFDRSARIGGVDYAAPSQVAVDLITAPGRGPSEGEALLDWMEANEDEWRT